MLAWATFPRAKRMVNARQVAALRARAAEPSSRLPGARTREQDALAMLDEGGLIVLSFPAVAANLKATVDNIAGLNVDQINLTDTGLTGPVTAAHIQISKDNVFFGVRAVSRDGHHSPAAFPVPSS